MRSQPEAVPGKVVASIPDLLLSGWVHQDAIPSACVQSLTGWATLQDTLSIVDLVSEFNTACAASSAIYSRAVDGNASFSLLVSPTATSDGHRWVLADSVSGPYISINTGVAYPAERVENVTSGVKIVANSIVKLSSTTDMALDDMGCMGIAHCRWIGMLAAGEDPMIIIEGGGRDRGIFQFEKWVSNFNHICSKLHK